MELSLSYNKIGYIDDLCYALQYVPRLQILFLRDNGFGSGSARALEGGLLHTPNLRILYLSSNSISETDAASIAPAFQHLPLLQILYFNDNQMGNKGAEEFAKVFKHLISLRSLSMKDNDIKMEGAMRIGEALPNLSLLEIFDIGDNNIGPEGGMSILTGLAQLPGMQKVYIGATNIGDEACLELVKTQMQRKLKELGMNNIGVSSDACINALAGALVHAPHLELLYLSDNRIGDEQALKLASMLHHLPKLRILDLRGNGDITEDGEAVLASARLEHPNVEDLEIKIDVNEDG